MEESRYYVDSEQGEFFRSFRTELDAKIYFDSILKSESGSRILYKVTESGFSTIQEG
jgi:hypothetical protein